MSRPSRWRPASEVSGEPLLQLSLRSIASWRPAVGSASPSGGISRLPPEPGLWRHSGWLRHRRSKTKRRWLLWAGRESEKRLLFEKGFVDIERFDVPFAWEFADPETYARSLAATGPAYEAIQNVGEEEFVRSAIELARAQMRDGLVLRAEIKVSGFIAHKPDH